MPRRIALIAFTFSAYMLGGPQVPKDQKPNSAANDNQAKDHSRPVPPTHVVIDPPLPTVASQSISNNSQNNAPEKSLQWFLRPEWIIIYVTAVYVFVTWLILRAMKRQANIMDRQARDAQAGAAATLNAINDQVALMRRQADTMDTQASDTRASAAGSSSTAQEILRAIEKQATLMERQAVVIDSQAKTIQQSADAATTSAETAKQSLIITQRAFFTFVRYQTQTMFEKPNNQGRFLGFRFIIEYENVGKTPAIEAEIIFDFRKIKKGESEDIVLPTWEQRDPRIPSTIAPGVKVNGIAELEPEEAERIASGDLSVFLYTQAQYRDVFQDTPIHHSGTCAKLVKIADLMSGSPFQFRLHSPKYNYGD